MPKIAAGVVKFQEEAFPKRKELFDKLSTGQNPEALFITCSDSRISPNLMTSTDPGELFIIRNAGNIVPPHTTHTGGTTASIEFAVGALGVKHIVVCGHTQCGAMKGAMNPEGLDALPHVREWIGYSRAAVQVVAGQGDKLSDDDKMAMLIEQNVLLQLTHLKTHPYVAAALAAGSVQLHGWVYDIKSGEVHAWDEDEGRFKPVSERYREEVAAHAAQVTAQDH
ncbi:carbonic anhydrase [Parvularcula oceani]|uniref:carbonic anhydrase n=1 Tax=Parvularcula oceani TaxID=1247963 RepID=UPI0004E11D7B|nr:carbonic anhydrase [Parvularcula oceani]